MTSNQLRLADYNKMKMMACSFASNDQIGYVLAKSFDLISTVVKDGLDGQNVRYLSQSLAQERVLAMKLDVNSSDPLREMMYCLIGSVGSMIEEMIERREMEQASLNIPNDFVVKDELDDDAVDVEGKDGDERSEHTAVTPSVDKMRKEENEKETVNKENDIPDDFIVKDEPEDFENILGNGEDSRSVHTAEDVKLVNESTLDEKMNETSGKEQEEQESDRSSRKRRRLTGHDSSFKDDERSDNEELVIDQDKNKFPCTVCSFTFRRPSALRAHMCLHTGERPHKCTVDDCIEGFTCSSQLKHHLRIEHGIKPHECASCGQRFDYLNQLYSHKKRNKQCN